ncbi:MAG: hypothetical protein DRN03_05820 [Thermoplasmata archaeon]|nr:MAG: hypothetical protein DRN03_05820 [Thermoplasmata archaeon]
MVFVFVKFTSKVSESNNYAITCIFLVKDVSSDGFADAPSNAITHTTCFITFSNMLVSGAPCRELSIALKDVSSFLFPCLIKCKDMFLWK